jgi:hypothetical protein
MADATPPEPTGTPGPLDLEPRRGGEARTPEVEPLLLERWAIVLRRSRAGYEGYAEDLLDPAGVADVDAKPPPPDASLVDTLRSRFQAFRRRMRGAEPRST